MKKNTLLYTLLLALAIALGACSEKEEAAGLSVDPAQITLDKNGQAVQFTVTTAGAWEITKPAGTDWLTVKPTVGKGITTITVIAGENLAADSYSTSLTVKAGAQVVSIQVKQLGADFALPAAAGTITGDYSNNCPYSVSVELTVDPVARAESYQWYESGRPVAVTKLPSYDVTATGAYSVAGINAAGVGTPSPEKRVVITDCSLPGKPAIKGDSQNKCPAKTVLLTTDPASNAVSYQWYRDYEPIPGATASTYEVHESGFYTVAGVNALGAGEESTGQEVIISFCEPTLVDKMVGSWQVVEGFYDGVSEYYPIEYTVEIIKTSETTISIKGLWNGLFKDGYQFSLHNITVDTENATMTIPNQKIEDGLMKEEYDTYFCAKAIKGADVTAGSIVVPIKNEDGALSLSLLSQPSDPKSDISYFINVALTGTTVCDGYVFVVFNSKWKKGSAPVANKTKLSTHSIPATIGNYVGNAARQSVK